MTILLTCDHPDCNAIKRVTQMSNGGRICPPVPWCVVDDCGDGRPVVACCRAHLVAALRDERPVA
jgi:hypothetical protein